MKVLVEALRGTLPLFPEPSLAVGGFGSRGIGPELRIMSVR